MLVVTDPSPTLSTSQEARRLQQRGIDVIHLGGGKSILPLPEIIQDAVYKSISAGPVGLTDSRGSTELREVLADNLQQELQINAHPEEFVVTVGAKEAVMATILGLTGSGDEILLPDPSWIGYEPWIRRAGATPIYYTMSKERDYRPDWSEVSEKLTSHTRLLILITPHNPTGTVLRDDELEALAEVVANHPVQLVTDESNARLVFKPARHISLAQHAQLRERTIVLRSFSKDYGMGGWRVGYAWSRRPTIQRIAAVHQHSVSCVPAFIQAAVLTLLQWDGREEYSRKLIDLYQQRRAIMVDGLNAMPGIKCWQPEGTFNVFPDVSALGFTSREYSQRLLDLAGITTVPGVEFGVHGEGHLRMAFTESPDRLEEALRRIAAVVAQLSPTTK